LVASLAPSFERWRIAFGRIGLQRGQAAPQIQVFEEDSYMLTLGRFTKQTQSLEYFKQSLSD
jgi:hypothetical protein